MPIGLNLRRKVLKGLIAVPSAELVSRLSWAVELHEQKLLPVAPALIGLGSYGKRIVHRFGSRYPELKTAIFATDFDDPPRVTNVKVAETFDRVIYAFGLGDPAGWDAIDLIGTYYEMGLVPVEEGLSLSDHLSFHQVRARCFAISPFTSDGPMFDEAQEQERALLALPNLPVCIVRHAAWTDSRYAKDPRDCVADYVTETIEHMFSSRNFI